jgi:transcriptional regulator with XRE-family HTH domain
MPYDRESLTAYMTATAAAAGWNQSALAESVGVATTTASGWTRGRTVASHLDERLQSGVGGLLDHRLAAMAAALNGFGAPGADLVEVRGQLARALLPGLAALVAAVERALAEDRACAKEREALAARAGEFVAGLSAADLFPEPKAEYIAQAGRGTGPVFDLIGGQAVPRAAQL